MSDLAKAKAERAKAAQAVATASSAVASVTGSLSKAGAQADKTRKELAGESDD